MWSRQHLLNTERFDLLYELLPKDAIPVSQEKLRSRVPRKSLPELLNRPLGGRMPSHAEMDNPPPLVCKHEKM